MPEERELTDFHEGFLYHPPPTDRIELLADQRQEELERLFGDRIEPGKRFLDVGGGAGMASWAADRLGLDVTLQEVDPRAIECFRAWSRGPEIRVCRDLSELGDERFDLIFADNVIEHVSDPGRWMARLYDRLAPGGRLVIKTPWARNTELLFHLRVSLLSYVWRVYKCNGLGKAVSATFFRPWSLDPPRHVYSFSPRSLMALAEQAGVDRMATSHYRLPLWRYALIGKLLRRPQNVRAVARWAVYATLAPIEILLKPFEAAFRRANLLTPAGLILQVERD